MGRKDTRTARTGPAEQPNAGGEAQMLTYVALRESHGGASGLCERLPTAPAIYAWFRTIRVPQNRGPEEFVLGVITNRQVT